MNRHLYLLPAMLPLLAGCGGHSHDPVPAPVAEPRPVSILVEVYDPYTNLVWENVSVRVVEADQEWSNSTWTSPYADWYLTDGSGRVWFDEYLLGAAEVGFFEDVVGRAMLSPRLDEDEALVVLEVAAAGFFPVFVEVPLRWDEPDVFVEVPFF
ncbi:MAG: hypothetical protein FJ265_00195 [Planctomycetes bacterium]|nr:hypothetical protein [Planctomycetota bacterium]